MTTQDIFVKSVENINNSKKKLIMDKDWKDLKGLKNDPKLSLININISCILVLKKPTAQETFEINYLCETDTCSCL